MEQEGKRIVIFGREFIYFGQIKEESLVRLLRQINFDGPNGCWLWQGYRNPNGYGNATVGGKGVLVHRFLWHVLRGIALPPEIDLHHCIEEPINCAGPQCCNPDHLEPLTSKEHLDRTPQHIMYLREWGGVECPQGHLLNDENVYTYPSGKRRCRACFNEWQTQRNRARAAEQIRTEPVVFICKNGHERTPENTYEYLGLRYCRACHNDFTSRQYHEKKQALGIATSKRVYFKDKTACKRGHDLTNPENVMVYQSKGEEKRTCRPCHEIHGRISYDKLKAAHARDPKPLRRKPGPKPLETSSLQISQ